MKQICKRCKKSWNYKGQKREREYSQYTTCPFCYTSVKLKFEGENKEEMKEGNDGIPNNTEL